LQGAQGPLEVPVDGPLRCNDFASLAMACKAGLGVAQLPLVQVLPELRCGELRLLHPELSPRGLQLFLHYPDRQLPARVRVFVDFILDASRHHPDLAVTPMDFAEATKAVTRATKSRAAPARQK
jgi:DNA-binding transcriptional LysR family regulator